MASNMITTEWKKNLLFQSDNPNGVQILMDTSIKNGGNDAGASPKALMLSSLAGCSGLDIVKISEKMRILFNDFKITIEANLTDDHPKFYDKVHTTYHFYGSRLDEEKLTKAVNLSVHKYCGVMRMFRKFAKVTTEIQFHTN